MTDYYKAIARDHDNGTISWTYLPRPGAMKGVGEDIWKGSVSIEVPLAAYSTGFDPDIDFAHMKKLNNVITKNIFLEDGRIDSTMSPGFVASLDDMPSSLVSTMSSWYRMSYVDESMVPLIRDYFAERPDVLPGEYLYESRMAIHGLVELKRYEKFGCAASR